MHPFQGAEAHQCIEGLEEQLAKFEAYVAKGERGD
jgi:hypothetical protein